MFIRLTQTSLDARRTLEGRPIVINTRHIVSITPTIDETVSVVNTVRCASYGEADELGYHLIAMPFDELVDLITSAG